MDKLTANTMRLYMCVCMCVYVHVSVGATCSTDLALVINVDDPFGYYHKAQPAKDTDHEQHLRN